jgi:hypothetical protein
VLSFTAWLALLLAAALLYPRKPQMAGGLFFLLGMVTVALRLQQNPGIGLATLSGAFWMVLGASYLAKFRTPEARAKHIEYWTAKS